MVIVVGVCLFVSVSFWVFLDGVVDGVSEVSDVV